jgi:hypothetical protein
MVKQSISNEIDLGEQSTNEGESANETGLDSEAHSTTGVTTNGTAAIASGLRGGRRSATKIYGSARERF